MNNLIGQKFGRWTIIRHVGKNKWGSHRWLCKCDCGNEKIIYGSHLRGGKTKSCGCLRKELLTKHGHNRIGKRSKTYRSWDSMIERCNNPNYKGYKNYGGRSITICQRWRKFENFLKDMGESPKGLQIDRINNNGNYCKSNCRWVTRKQQGRNTRRNRFITFNDITQCVSAWAEKYGMPHECLWNRLYIFGWSIEKALTTPIRKKRKKGK